MMKDKQDNPRQVIPKSYPKKQYLLAKDYPKTLECDQCGKMFAFQSKLDVHYRKHTGIRPYVCSFCGADFTQKNNLNTHCKLLGHNWTDFVSLSKILAF